MDEDFLLHSDTARYLYNEYAKPMPIIDYHCHLSAKDIANDRRYRNITELWLEKDHYKWRAMRWNGVDERYITGDADDKEKFIKWAETVNYCIGNPLYHWTHLELRHYFGIDLLLSPKTAEVIWEKCNAMLKNKEFSAKGLIKRSNVKVVCTTDDPADTLEYHLEITRDKLFGVRVLPSMRADNAISIENGSFAGWIRKLGEAAGIEIKRFPDLMQALSKSIEYFHQAGCRISDHSLESVVFHEGTDEEVDIIFRKALSGCELSVEEIAKYKTKIMLFLGREYARLGWVMQIHIGSTRNNNPRMMKLVGPDSGFDGMGDKLFGEALTKLLATLDETGQLPKTIFYCLNPRDNELICAIIGCFQGDGIPGRLQFGSAWWFNNHKDGMIRQMTTLANLGLLSRFVGMQTDSRSILSFTRHDYFRRILCNLIGEWVEKGEAPNDTEMLGNMIQDICCRNAEKYFNF